MPHLRFHGKVLKQYHGLDKDTVVVAGPGDVIHVSEEKAERLLKDFPTEFEIHRAHETEESARKAKPNDDQSQEEEQEVPEVETKDVPEPVKNKMIGKSKTKGKNKWR